MVHQKNDDRNSNGNAYELVLEKVVEKEFADIPAEKRNQFLLSLEMVRNGLKPALDSEKLHSAGKGVVELKINGRPAYRCMYVVLKEVRQVVVLHVTAKTAQGSSRALVETTSARLKALRRRMGS